MHEHSTLCASYEFVGGILVMELVVDHEGEPAPQLRQVRLAPERANFILEVLLRQIARMLCAASCTPTSPISTRRRSWTDHHRLPPSWGLLLVSCGRPGRGLDGKQLETPLLKDPQPSKPSFSNEFFWSDPLTTGFLRISVIGGVLAHLARPALSRARGEGRRLCARPRAALDVRARLPPRRSAGSSQLQARC